MILLFKSKNNIYKNTPNLLGAFLQAPKNLNLKTDIQQYFISQ